MNFDGTYPNGGLENGGVIRGDLLIDADAHITKCFGKLFRD